MTAPLIIRGDARHLPLPDASVDLVVTSPPYFALRSYTDGGRHYAGQLGSEATLAEFLSALSADYCRLATWRSSDPKERARAVGLDPTVVAAIQVEHPGQHSLFDDTDPTEVPT